jgi:hypothetical protein
VGVDLSQPQVYLEADVERQRDANGSKGKAKGREVLMLYTPKLSLLGRERNNDLGRYVWSLHFQPFNCGLLVGSTGSSVITGTGHRVGWNSGKVKEQQHIHCCARNGGPSKTTNHRSSMESSFSIVHRFNPSANDDWLER